MSCFRLLRVVSLLLLFTMVPAWAQKPSVQTPPPLGEPQTPMEAEANRRLLLDRQKKRFEDIQRDSQKLLELATQLKQYVDKSGQNVLSLDVIRKAEEMEKLAHHVKENMRAE